MRLEGGRSYPITFIDAVITNYEEVNQVQGLSASNELLKTTAEVLKTFRTEDVVARIDESRFAVLLPASSRATGEAILARLKGGLEKLSADIKPTIEFDIVTMEKETSLMDFLRAKSC